MVFSLMPLLLLLAMNPPPKARIFISKRPVWDYMACGDFYESIYDVYLCTVKLIALYFIPFIHVNANNLDENRL